jgi:hypothetical protein
MNLKQLGVLIICVVIIGGAAMIMHSRNNSSWSGGSAEVGKKLLGDFPVNDVAQIHFKQNTNELTLLKTNDLWMVRERYGYPADFSKISQLLLKLRDLKIVQSEQIGPSQLPRMNLAATGQGTNSATLVEFSDASGKPIRTLLLGKSHIHENRQASPEMGEQGWPDGRYVLTGSNATTVALISDPLSDINPQPSQWLDKTFFKTEKPRRVSVTFPAAVTTNSWSLTRESETNEWKLSDAKPGEQLDETKASGAANALSSPSFTDVLNPQAGDFKRPTEVEIEDFDGFKYSIKVGGKPDDEYQLKVTTSALFGSRTPGKDETAEQKAALDKAFQENQEKLKEKLQRETQFNNWTYLVPGWTLDPILKTRAQLLVEKTDATNGVSTAESPAEGKTTNSASAE